MTNNATQATVITLTAEVRTLMVESRQVTLSVARQLDHVESLADMDIMGRIRLTKDEDYQLIGRDKITGSLVLAYMEDKRTIGSSDVPVSDLEKQSITLCCSEALDYRFGMPAALRHVLTIHYRTVGFSDLGVMKVIGSHGHALEGLESAASLPFCYTDKHHVIDVASNTLQSIKDQIILHDQETPAHNDLVDAAKASPLIVLAGLR